MKQEETSASKIIALIVMVAIGWGLYSMFSGGGTDKSKPTNAPSSYSDMTEDMELMAVTYAQMSVKEYIPNAKMPHGTAGYKVIRTDNRYKIEGTADGERFWVVINWDYEKPDSWEIVSVQVGDIKYKQSR